MVDLQNALSGDERSQLLDAIESLKISAAVGDGPPLDEFETFQGSIENIEMTGYDRQSFISLPTADSGVYRGVMMLQNRAIGPPTMPQRRMHW